MISQSDEDTYLEKLYILSGIFDDSLTFEEEFLGNFLYWDVRLLLVSSSFHSSESCLDFTRQSRRLAGVPHYISANWTTNELSDFFIPTAYKPPRVTADGLLKVSHFRMNMPCFLSTM